MFAKYSRQNLEFRLCRAAAVSVSALAICGLGLTACSNPDDKSAAGPDGADAERTLVLLDNNETGAYNPVSGYSRSGDSPVYEGLFRLKPAVGDASKRPVDFEPLLAAGPAEPSNGNKTWTVALRGGITFSDGSTFGPEDVVATYKAILDERSASSEALVWEMLDDVRADGNKVVFELNIPYAEFDHQLLNGIAPSEAFDFENLKPAEESSLNTKPVGTGPFKLESLRADEAVFTARDDYHGGAPELKKVIYRVNQDENSRAQQLRGGEGDGTIMEPALAQEFEGKDGFKVESAHSADWRGITLPTGNPVTGDQAIRNAVNLAVDRQAMAKDVMKGRAKPNSTFLTDFYGDAYDPAAEIKHDTAKAEKILDEAGWEKGPDGIRIKGGQRATFDVIYFPNRDHARTDLTLATASDLKKIGIEVNPVARDSKSVNREDYAKTPVMLGGGGTPYSVDGQIYSILHSKYAEPGAGAKWDNGSDYVNPEIDKLLDQARIEPDQAKRDGLYRKVQKLYAEKPAMLQLVYVDHVYVERNRGYSHPTGILEPHAHGLNFGPWFNLGAWHK
ncbi:MAG: ABC transporter substrate-binding protein [Corynebacterium sp.]|uniref:ABC transporter substrate-binding protein n=1 Tax=Corynebacterium sp. TaxID=1720 RepID=UPI0026DC23D8|nr:ABC transporter substrate-binding protein [Corynebacterium sp.]MDO5030867.1 ABC transporter substrate-binding protein [Corynebacterium sp.]